MSWQDRLTTASFRDFEFLTESHDAKSGRRLVVHEFPNSDSPVVEDFGLKTNTYRLNAYFIGADYDQEANGFLAKLAQTGADWLNHPWLGQVWVRAQDWSRSESNDKGGYCVISIDFVADGRAPYVPTVDKVDVAIDKTRVLTEAIQDDFDLKPMSSDALTAFKANISKHLEGIRDAIAMASLPLAWANAALNQINGVKNDIDVLMQIPQQYASALGSFANVLGTFGDSLEVSANTRARAVARITNTATNPPAIVASDAAATISPDFKINSAREAALRSQMLIVSAAQIALTDYQDAGTRDAVLDKLLTAIDSQLPNMSDTVFEAAVDARTALIEALLAQDLTTAVQRDIVNAVPSVVLAYQMGIDEGVLIAQNAVIHPLFVQGRVYG